MTVDRLVNMMSSSDSINTQQSITRRPTKQVVLCDKKHDIRQMSGIRTKIMHVTDTAEHYDHTPDDRQMELL